MQKVTIGSQQFSVSDKSISYDEMKGVEDITLPSEEAQQFLKTNGFLFMKNLFKKKKKNLKRLRNGLLHILETSLKHPANGIREIIINILEGFIVSGTEYYDEKKFREAYKREIQEDLLDTLVYSSELKQCSESLLGPNYHFFPGQAWLRVKATHDSTIEHVDYFYYRNYSEFKRFKKLHKNNPNKVIPVPLYTFWISLSDLSFPEDSMLCILEKSHTQLVDYACPQPKPPKEPLLPEDYKKKKDQLVWKVPRSLDPGDIIIFNGKTVHAASKQERSKKYRVSIDLRYFLK